MVRYGQQLEHPRKKQDSKDFLGADLGFFSSKKKGKKENFRLAGYHL
jgi:hypothetical protein